jgi:hypothetical protein
MFRHIDCRQTAIAGESRDLHRQTLDEINGCAAIGLMREVRMFLIAIALAATTIVVVMLIMACFAMFKDVSEAREDLYDRIEQVRRVVTSVSEEDGEEALAVYRRAQPFRRNLEETAD